MSYVLSIGVPVAGDPGEVLELPRPAQRLAWLVENLPKLPGSGIVYTLTKRDAEQVAGFLTDHLAVRIGERRIKGRRKTERRRELRHAREARRDPVWTVLHGERRDTQRRNSRTLVLVSVLWLEDDKTKAKSKGKGGERREKTEYNVGTNPILTVIRPF